MYLVKPDSTVTVRNVTLGTTEGDDTEITSGLKPGDVPWSMTGVDKLNEGTRVVAQLSGGSRPAGSSGATAGAKAAAARRPGGKRQ